MIINDLLNVLSNAVFQIYADDAVIFTQEASLIRSFKAFSGGGQCHVNSCLLPNEKSKLKLCY